MVWSDSLSRIGIVLARSMTNSHQGGILFELDQETLEMQYSSWSSSHSFANTLTVDSTGAFLGMDLGDNFPRGIHMWRFSEGSKKDRLVYGMKTMHATYADGKPVYTEISTAEQTYYKWSNDNYVYTELAHPGIVEVDDGLLVFFAGEFPSLDNSMVGSAMNVPRNAAFVKVPKDLSSRDVLSVGPVETGGFYDYGGGWTSQRIEGIVSLTSYSAMDQSVSRMKTLRMENRTLLWWELWSGSAYMASQYMVVDDNGEEVVPVRTVDFPVRVGIADDPRVVGSSVVLYAGTPKGKLVRYEMCLDPEEPTTSPIFVDGEPISRGASITVSAVLAVFAIICGIA